MIFLFAFHNTESLTGEELARRKEQARKQRAVVLSLFESAPTIVRTPSEVQAALGYKFINSVRRAMTDLTSEGKLRKTDEQKRNPESGHMEHYWKLVPQNERNEPQKLF